jgi:glycosyltransferase involved in cell wall biosynthesis
VRHTGIWSRGVDAEEFSPRWRSEAWRAQFGVGPDDPLVAYVGRVAPEKNLPLLLEAWRRLEPVRGNAQLVIVGEGIMEDTLRRHRIPGVHLVGFLHGPDLSRAYASADVFAFPSTTETFGNVLLEAMASGCAPVVAEAGGVMDFTAHEQNALWTRPDHMPSFAEQLGRLLTDAPLRHALAHAARRTAESRDWASIYDQLEHDYREAVQARAGVSRAA